MNRLRSLSASASLKTLALAVATALALAACGGGGGGSSSAPSNPGSPSAPGNPAPPAPAPSGSTPITASDAPGSIPSGQSGAPIASSDMAVDGFAWFNYRRGQAGLGVLSSNAQISMAAYNHSNYQRLADQIGHDEIQGKPGFTGTGPKERMQAAGYSFSNSLGYAYGEVISATGGAGGQSAAEELLAAIYHRFVILEPTFNEGGAGAGTSSTNYKYFTADFAARGFSNGVGAAVAVYPFSGQTKLPRVFYTDTEQPDPVAGKNAVGYPVSVHADITSSLTTQSFTLRKRGASADAPSKLLLKATDAETPDSAAALIPLDPLDAGVTYDANFVGALNGIPLTKSWSFTTR